MRAHARAPVHVYKCDGSFAGQVVPKDQREKPLLSSSGNQREKKQDQKEAGSSFPFSLSLSFFLFYLACFSSRLRRRETLFPFWTTLDQNLFTRSEILRGLPAGSPRESCDISLRTVSLHVLSSLQWNIFFDSCVPRLKVLSWLILSLLFSVSLGTFAITDRQSLLHFLRI